MIIRGAKAKMLITLRRETKSHTVMKKLISIIIAGVILALTLSAKVIRRQLSIFRNNVPETETIARGTTEFVYDYSYSVDTLDRLDDSRVSDRMLLQISPDGISKFSSFRNLTVDSILMRSSREQIADAAIEGKLSNGEFMTIYKNYPEGKLTHTEKICTDWLCYREEMPVFDWEPLDSVTEVLGYECRGARCRFRGREWTVFYTEDIPVSDGPWKLCGLPGLIMKASDDKGHYTFGCVGIKSGSERPITVYKVPYNDVSRNDFYDTRHRYDVNPYAYYETTTGSHVTVVDEAGNPTLDAYDPIELPFEYIERDWKK